MTSTRRSAFALAALLLGSSQPACTDQAGDARRPTADAGDQQVVAKGALVTLDGRGSSGQGPLTFLWAQIAGAPVALSSSDVAQPAFTAPHAAGVLRFTLVVRDGLADSPPATVDVEVVNRRPVAWASAPGTTSAGLVVTLDGRSSQDDDGDALTYLWSQTSGPPVVLADGVPGTAHFTAPAVTTPTPLGFALAVGDGDAFSTNDASVEVTVFPPGFNMPPVADAGPDRVVARNTPVFLAGWGADPEHLPITFLWTQTAGPAVTLADATAQYTAFAAPAGECDLTFRLEVSDGLSTSADELLVLVRNQAHVVTSLALQPAAPAGGDDLTALATAADPDGDPVSVSYRWTRNGVEVAGFTGPVFPASETTRGDVIAVHVTASDGVLAATGDATATAIIQDSPPVLSATPPAQASPGVPVAFQVTAADPDGDPVGALVLAYGPAGMEVTAAGQVSWTPSGPMFDRAMDVHWGVAIQGHPESLLAGAIRLVDPARQVPLLRTSLARPAPRGLVVGDLDGDGRAEILVGSASGLYELGPSGGGYAQRWVDPIAANGTAAIQAVVAADLDGDGRQELFVAAGEAVVELDGATRREVARYAGAGQVFCRDLAVADLEPDGAKELVCLGSASGYAYEPAAQLVVLDAATLAVRWSTPTAATLGSTLAVGNVDGDAALELVTSGGYVYDGKSQAGEWAYGPGFGQVGVGDLDGDGVAEIVGAQAWDVFRGFSAVLKSPLWEVARFNTGTLHVADLDGDGQAEILIGDAQWGSVTAFRYVAATNSLASVFDMGSQGGVGAIGVGDVDGDGAREVVWSGSATLYDDFGASSLFVAGLDPGVTLEWMSHGPAQLDGPFVGGALASLGPGVSRLLFAVGQTNNGYQGTRLLTLEPASGLVEASAELGTNWNQRAAVAVTDYDHDGVDEVFLATSSTYDGYFTAYDVLAKAAEWTSPTLGYDAYGVAVVAADLNADGFDDLVSITGNGHVMVEDVRNQALLWSSTAIGSYGIDLAVADLRRDGTPMIVALGASRLVAYAPVAGPVGWVEWASRDVAGGVDLVVADCDGDGAPEIYVVALGLSVPSQVLRFDAALAPLGSFPLDVQALSLFVEDLGFPRKNLIVGTGSGWYPESVPSSLRAVDAVSGALVWRSPDLVGNVRPNSLWFVDAAGDGRTALAFGTTTGMYLTR